MRRFSLMLILLAGLVVSACDKGEDTDSGGEKSAISVERDVSAT